MAVKRKSSARVTLVLLGVAALSGCSREPQSKRDVYASREDCLADWGNKAEDCTPATDRPRHTGGYYFYGPSYSSPYYGSTWDRWWGRSSWSGSGARPGSHAVASASSGGGSSSGVSRGGFGSTGRSSAG